MEKVMTNGNEAIIKMTSKEMIRIVNALHDNAKRCESEQFYALEKFNKELANQILKIYIECDK